YMNSTLNEVIKDKTSGVNSHAIAIAATILVNINTIDIHDDDIKDDLRDVCLELAFLLSDTDSLNSHDLEIYNKFYTGITKVKTLDISYLVNLQKNYKYYSNQNIEQKTTYRIQNLDYMNSVFSNMISNLIASYTSNLEISQTKKLCEIQ
ncbi:6223_t:CDS:2, partial [Scutellospora calospora]